MSTTNTVTRPEELLADGTVTVEMLKAEFGIRRTTAYELMNKGLLPWSKVTGRRLIPRLAVKRLIASGLTEPGAGVK